MLSRDTLPACTRSGTRYILVGGEVILGYEFDKAVLRYIEYPPDANRRFDIARLPPWVPPTPCIPVHR